MNRKIFTNLCAYAQQAELKDLVISEGEQQITIDGYQTNGEHRRFILPKKLEQEFFTNLQKILHLQAGELISNHSRRNTKSTSQVKYRLSTAPGHNYEKIIINIVNEPVELWRLNQLGLARTDLQTFKTVLQKTSGLIIISSPVGQGKSTTLRSLLFNLDSEQLNIYVLEDQPAYKLPGINILPAQLNNLDKIIKHDSDCIFIDDLDQPGLLKKAILAASTGRLVVGALTADSAYAALNQVLSIDLPLSLKLDSLKLISNQRLAPMKRRITTRSHNRRRLIGLFELLKLSPASQKIISTGADLTPEKLQAKLHQLAVKEGFRSWSADQQQKITEGLL